MSALAFALAALTAYLLRALLAQRRVRDGQRIRLYRRIVGELPVGIAVVRLEDSGKPETWRIVEMNTIGQMLSGSRAENVAGRLLLDFAPELRDSALTRACAEALRHNRGVEVDDFISTKRVPGGHFSIKVFPLGAPLVGLVFENITARRKAEDALVRSQQALEKRTAELARSNTELTQFAYVASHDLQAPLRKASAFAEQLKSRLAGRLDETDKDFMRRLDRSLSGMQDLIDALLSLARVATHAEPHRAVDLALVAADVLGDLEEPLARADGTVRVEGLPVVMGDPNQMRQLLQNLIGNALKFRRPGLPPEIRVSGRPAGGGRCELRVSDNGVGFAMKFAGRIFQPFQRLHSAKDYPGTGMGLAICHKIVERHGGGITADSVPGRGSSFTVVLPAGPPGEIECLASSASKTTRTSRPRSPRPSTAAATRSTTPTPAPRATTWLCPSSPI